MLLNAGDRLPSLAVNREYARLVRWYCFGVWLLILFFGRLTAQLRSSFVEPTGCLAVLAGECWSAHICSRRRVRLATSELGDYGPDAGALSSLAAVFLDRSMSAWFGRFSVLIVALLLALVIGNLVGLAGMVGVVWIVVASMAMLVGGPPVEERDSA
jgi:hypothetical protein